MMESIQALLTKFRDDFRVVLAILGHTAACVASAGKARSDDFYPRSRA